MVISSFLFFFDPSDFKKRFTLTDGRRIDDIEEDTAERGPELLTYLSEVIRNIPDLFSFPDPVAHFGLGVEETVSLGVYDLVMVDPNRIRNELRCAVDHLEKTHHAEHPFDVTADGLFICLS